MCLNNYVQSLMCSSGHHTVLDLPTDQAMKKHLTPKNTYLWRQLDS